MFKIAHAKMIIGVWLYGRLFTFSATETILNYIVNKDGDRERVVLIVAAVSF